MAGDWPSTDKEEGFLEIMAEVPFVGHEKF